jgi:hypothetical protein
MRWGVRQSVENGTVSKHSISTTSTPKVGATTLDQEGKPAVILKVKPGSVLKIEAALGRKLRDNEKAYDITTQNSDQAEVQKELERKAKKWTNSYDVVQAVQRTASFVLRQDSLSPAVEDILEHIGVKGMRWGVRKSDRSSSDGDSTIKVTTKSGKGIVKVSGGKGIDPSEDAVKVAAAKQKAKSSTTAALSNDEMKLLVGRMQLEQQYAKLLSESNQKKKSKGMEFGSWLLKAEGSARLKGKTGPVTEAVRLAMNVAAAASPGTGKHVKKVK